MRPIQIITEAVFHAVELDDPSFASEVEHFLAINPDNAAPDVCLETLEIQAIEARRSQHLIDFFGNIE